MTATILRGDAAAVLRTLPDNSVHCVVTSPPYYGLRDYGVDGQIGAESTPAEYVERLVAVFREVRRVLRPDGVCWLNLGDSYNGSAPNRTGQNGYADGRTNRNKRFATGGVSGLKPKDLLGIPWRVAFALQDDGWWLRSDVIFAKPNPMPESVTDRCTRAHEYVFMLTKSARYFYDAQAVAEPALQPLGEPSRVAQHKQAMLGQNGTGTLGTNQGAATRNRRSVWTIATEPTPYAHFATMPSELAEICILAGCPGDGTVLDPFAGSGTTLRVALTLGRNAIGIELNPEYVDLAERLLNQTQPALFGI